MKTSPKPRITFLIPRLGIVDRGAEVFVYELAKNLRRDFEITIYVRFSTEKYGLISDLEKLGVQMRRVRSVSEDHWLVGILYAIAPFRPTLEKFHLSPFEVEMLTFSLACLRHLLTADTQILFPANGVWGVFVCRVIRFVRGTPFIYASLGGIEPLVAKQKPDIYVSTNQGIERWLKKNYPNLRVKYISTGVDLKKFSPYGKRADIDLPRPIFIIVSALVPEKRVDLTIKAVAKLKKGSLLIVGDGPLKLKLLAEADKYLGEDRYLFRSVGYEELDEYYRAADVFTHAAPWELGWSMVILEALATNLPVVANREENVVELLRGVGMTCDVTDTNEYARALRRALTLKSSDRPRRLIENFHWTKIAGQYQKLLYNLLK